MNIQWFPGHMTKALRMMEANVGIVDIVGYVLDARAPMSCFNPSFEKIIGNKPCLFILNKCDLADKSKVDLWCNYFAQSGIKYVKVTATASAEASKITSAFGEIAKGLKDKLRAKGVYKPVRCLILGVPNCGKSTLINCLAGKKSVVTGDRPGVTKGKQWVRLQNGLELLDTPGTLWPKFEDEKVASRLCFVGSIKDDIVEDIYALSLLLVEELQTQYPKLLEERYKLQVENKQPDVLFEEIAKKRGYVVRGGEIDYERTAKAILDDFRKGKIGKVTFDVPPQAHLKVKDSTKGEQSC